MANNQQLLNRLLVTTFTVAALSSCNNSGEIPFPEKEYSYTQPVTLPLKLSVEKKLNWDTASRSAVTPVTKKLDIESDISNI